MSEHARDWRRRVWLPAVAALMAAALAGPRAVQPEIDFATIDEAMTLGGTTRGSERARFHEAYRLIAATAPVDYVEIVTPFRRVVLAAQSSLARGERRLAQREALELLARAPRQMDVYVELTFHPQNTYVGVPEYTVALVGAKGARVDAATTNRVPRFGPRLEGLPPPLAGEGLGAAPQRSAPLVGGTLVATFDLRAIDPEGTYDVAIEDGETILARVLATLGRLR
jgi:hypothetical protein